jgi:hypothetical protein
MMVKSTREIPPAAPRPAILGKVVLTEQTFAMIVALLRSLPWAQANPVLMRIAQEMGGVAKPPPQSNGAEAKAD